MRPHYFVSGSTRCLSCGANIFDYSECEPNRDWAEDEREEEAYGRFQDSEF